MRIRFRASRALAAAATIACAQLALPAGASCGSAACLVNTQWQIHGIPTEAGGTLFQLLTADFQLRRLGKAIGALAVLAYALANLRIDWDLGRVAMLLGMQIAFSSFFLFAIEIQVREAD